MSKIAIVTGGTKGIGLATVNKLVEKGFVVYACARNSACFSSGAIHFHYLDLLNKKTIDQLVTDVIQNEGKIDVLVNNAGIVKDSLTKNMSESDFVQVINVDLIGIFNLVKAVAPFMESQGEGSIVNVSSIVGEYGNIGQANYSAAKAGLIGMTKTWAKEFSRKGAKIRVNAVAPGFINTSMLADVPETILEQIKAKIPLKRLGDPDEVANVISFLCGDESSYITGATIDVNGGLVL